MPRIEGVVLSVYAPSDLVAEIRERAELEERSLSARVRRALKSYLNDESAAGQGDALKTAGERRHAAGR